VPLSVGAAGSASNTMSPAWAKDYFHMIPIKWHLDPSSRLATIDMGRKIGVVRGCARFGGGQLGPHLTQCGLCRGLPSYK